MPLAKVSDGALTPDLHEVIVQSGADYRADDGNQPRRPFLHNLRAGAGRDALDHPRHKLRHELLLHQFAADVHSRRAGGRDPQLSFFFFGVVGKAVDQAELLDHAQGDGGQDAEIGQHGEHAAHAETGALGGGHPHAGANGLLGDVIEQFGIHRVHAVVGKGGKVVGHPQMFEIFFGIDLDGVVGLHEGVADGVFQPTPDPALLVRCVPCSLQYRRDSALRGSLRAEPARALAVLASKLADAYRKTTSCTPRRTRRIRHELHGHSLG